MNLHRSVVLVPPFALLLLLLCSCTPVHAVTQSFELQRRFGSDATAGKAEWDTVAIFTLSRKTQQSPYRLTVQPSSDADLTREQKSALVAADLLLYRAVPQGSGNFSEAVTIAVTPCSLIRGFDAVDSRTVLLREQLNVVPGTGVTLMGLQLSSKTNVFHSKMLNGDECDRSIVDKLFPVVRIKTEVGLLRPVELSNTVHYEELRYITGKGKDEEAVQEGRSRRTEIRKVRNANGELVEKEVPVEEKTFFQKYGFYIVLGLGISIARSYFQQ